MKNKILYLLPGIFLFSFFNISAQTRELIVEPIEPCDSQYMMRWYYDGDGDGYGDPMVWRDSCSQPFKHVSNNKDCNDSNSSVTTAQWWYPDNDFDGLGSSSGGMLSCLIPRGSYVNNNDDCDDSREEVGSAKAWYKDLDKDGEGGVNSNPTYNCNDPSNSTYSYSLSNKDCDDSDPQVQQITWYYDGDGDTYGDPSNFKKQCSKPYGSYVTNGNDLCPDVSGFEDGCPPAGRDVTELWNTVQITEYDRDGTIRGKAKTYYDELGQLVQSQELDVQSRKVWASQVFYDSYGRSALRTFTAPTNSDIPGDFLFRSNFIKKADNTVFSNSDFENLSGDPSVVGNQSNSLGWYYSSANTSEPYQDITDRPYIKTEYSKLNPDKILRTLGGNKKAGDWKNGYSFTMRAAQELAQAGAFNSTVYNSYKIVKTVVRNVQGVENVLFTDTDGKTLAAARSGGSTARVMSVDIPKEGFLDIHIPEGSNAVGITISNPTSRSLKIYDLVTENVITPSLASLSSGFYRISIVNPDNYDPSVQAITVSYKENYYDYSLNKYDKAGRLIETLQPLNKLKTTFTYNSLGQLTYTKSPDEGEAWFKYRTDGKIRYSQNSKQKMAGEFSYTEYDNLGRPIESGVVKNSYFTTIDPNATVASGVKIEQQFTTYDALNSSDISTLSGVNPAYSSPSFLLGNVAKTRNANVTSYYSYDIYGRLKWMVQNISGLGIKTIDYVYDEVTGAVTLVDYQKYSAGERFVHRYSYDIKGQLTKVETSTNGTNYLTQAQYDYYETGALKRKVIGDGLQGMDYVYNLEGALKSINHPELSSSKDPGGDANDIFGMTIHYNAEDFKRTNTPKPIGLSSLGTEQYGGNIKGIEWKTFGSTAANYFYNYNRNNWLTSANFNLGSGTADYRVDNISYDPNGNILSLRRNKQYENGSNAMDHLTYRYKAGTNQLSYVDDAVTASTDANDIKDQASGNYTYNSIGQLISNAQDGITYFYSASGLVTKVQGNSSSVEFFYDDRGNRIKKVSTSGTISTTTFYVRDALGKPLAVYSNNSLEHPVFGASRIGVAKRTIGQTSLAQQNYFYELTDHLGNVRAVVQKNSSGNAVALVKTDYYPFGMPMPSRNVQGDYRYAYQGQEKDSETGMEAFELRLWDSRIGRWLTTDPYAQYSSPYLGMGNNPITLIDPDGGFDTWFGAFLFKLFNGGGEINKNDNGSFTLGQTYYDNGCDCTGVEIISGNQWERNLSGSFNLFNDSFKRIGAIAHNNDGPVTTAWTTYRMNVNLSVSKNPSPSGQKVNPEDYMFNIAAGGFNTLAPGTVNPGMRVSVHNGRNLLQSQNLTPKQKAYISPVGGYPIGEASFTVPELNSGRIHIKVHGTWTVKTESGSAVPVQHPIFTPWPIQIKKTIF